ncbi:MAG: bifunctional DNA primase/polymerase [Desulfovibrio desulfuricans]|nr:bifunctional DNA primase/polymerase [Desulfovibrio desulfuricans]
MGNDILQAFAEHLTAAPAEGGVMNDSMSMLQAALGYAKRGKPVFPCNPENKRPYTRHGFKDASTDSRMIEKWWAENPAAMVGMPTGPASGLWAVDCDGREGVERFRLSMGLVV